MKPFTEYFTTEQIIRELCKARMKLAEQRNEQQYIGRLVGGHPQRHFADAVDNMLPTRKAWHPFRPRYRYSGKSPDCAALQRATLTLRTTQPSAPWVSRLEAFINQVQQRVLHAPTFTFAKPEVRWELKKDNDYRALCRFELADNLINGLTAKYLKDYFEPAFEASSYAFRATIPNQEMPTHHTAFNRIFQIRQAAKGQDLYVAECDIRGFYDSVDHGIALAALNRLAHLIENTMPDRVIDARSVTIYQAYLDCYSFPQNVLSEALNHLKAEVRAGTFPWPADALRKHHADPLQARIGVPQGGAISCLIANLVLDLADKRIKTIQQNSPGLEYLRYCDDMVLISPSKAVCRRAYQTYLEALDELKLPYHPAQIVEFYGKDFWEAKSKAPYCWTGRKRLGCVPWVQFVGYQVRYDGLVRPKKKSVAKQLNALKETVDVVKYGLLIRSRPFPRPYEPLSIRASKKQAVDSVRSRLVCKGVGRVKVNQPTEGPLPMCWANGFRALHGKPLVPSFLKKLDRERERQIRRFKRAQIVYGLGIPSSGNGKRQEPNGYLFSYSAQFCNNGGADLVNNPYREPWYKRWLLMSLKAKLVAKGVGRVSRLLVKRVKAGASII